MTPPPPLARRSPRRPVLAVGVVCFKDDDVLLIRRGTPPLAGEWSIPGGRIEFGEPAETAAARELFEETGIRGEICGLIDVVDAIFHRRADEHLTRHYLLVDYAARWQSGVPVAGDDAAHAAFVPIAQLNEIKLWSETRRIIEVARQRV